MASYDVFDALNDCLDRLNAGQSLDDCLRAHPQHADRLLPLLETAVLVRRAHPAVPPGAKMRVREQVMAAVPRRPLRARFTQPSLALAAASLLVVGFVVAMLVVARRDPDQSLPSAPTDAHTPTPEITITSSPTVTPSATQTATVTPTAIATASPSLTHTATPTPTDSSTTAPSPPVVACTFTIIPSSINLRSGPGTGYAIVGYGYAGEVLTVSARNSSGDWLQIELVERDAWVAASLGSLAGDCTTLPISTTSLRPAADSDGTAPESGQPDDDDDWDDDD